MKSNAVKHNQSAPKSRLNLQPVSTSNDLAASEFSRLQSLLGNRNLHRLFKLGSTPRDSNSSRASPQSISPVLPSNAPPVSLQAKLTINSSGDAFEREADGIAAQVTSISESQVQRKCNCETGECNKCGSAQATNQHVKTKRVSTNVSDRDLAPPKVTEVLESSGQPLDSSIRSYMESRFGHDFSQVRIHTDAKAEASAEALSAHAYTVGHHIAFGAGQFEPGTDRGRRLLAHELTHTIQQGSVGEPHHSNGKHGFVQRQAKTTATDDPQASLNERRIFFVRDEGLNLREEPNQKSKSLARLPFGQRVYILEESNPGWPKIAVMGRTGYVLKSRLHDPPDDLIKKDPGLSLVKVKPGQTFWGLVKEVYGIQGNEGARDRNINHFINAIRAVNKPEAFKVKEDTLDKIGNYLLSGRDATDTFLIAGVDLWIPSFNVAARMDVGSGTIRGELTRIIRAIDQKITDFKTACAYSVEFIPGAIKKRVGDMALGLIEGLIDFALDAAKILAISTAIGALIGAIFGGVGAIPGAEIGFEIGLIILEYYGLYVIIEAIVQVAVGLFSALADFVKLVWVANGDQKQLKEAGKALADALGILVSAVLAVLVAYLLKKGADFIKGTKFGQKVGASRLAKWLEERKQGKTSNDLREKAKAEAKAELRKQELSKDPQTGKTNQKSVNEAEAILQAENEGLVKNARRPDLNKGEPNLDFKIDGPPPYKWADTKTPVNRGNLVAQAEGIGEKVFLQKAGAADVLHVVDLKNIPAAAKGPFMTNVIKGARSTIGIVFINK